MSDVKDISRECEIQVSWPIIVGPLSEKLQRQSIDGNIKFYWIYGHHLCNLYGRFTFSLYAKIKSLCAIVVDDKKISILDLNLLHFGLLKLPHYDSQRAKK